MKRTLLALITTIALLIAAVAAPLAALAGEATDLPAVGEVVHGFKTINTYDIKLPKATCVVMEHEKTGAKLVYMACEDTNRAFSISFRTPAVNDKGIPHVYEHATLCGSEKYPDPSLFFSMMSQTYNTYLNAMTLQTSTIFPNASLSEEQLLRFMDYTLSGVFYPIIMTDERAMMREAYRYELQDKDADITLTGTVYSEMQGNQTITSAAANRLRKVLYPGSITANNSGGDPADIPKLTHQELKDFHDTYYHPSNALVMLYGKLDYRRFLRAIDEDYLSAFDRREITLTDDEYQPIEGYREEVVRFPVAQDAASNPVAMYGISLPGATMEDIILMNAAASSLAMEGEPLYALIKEKLPDIIITPGIDIYSADPTFYVLGTGVGEKDMQTFKAAMDEALLTVVAEGLNMDIIRANCRRQHYQEVIAASSANIGVNSATEFSGIWALRGDIDAYREMSEANDRINEYAETDKFNEVFRKYFTKPVRSALVVSEPEQGGLERRSAELKKQLADMKAAMTEEEIEALVARTADFNAWTAANAENSMIDRIKVVDAKSLPEEVVAYAAETREVGGMTAITSQVELDDLVQIELQFDASMIPPEMMHAYSMFANMVLQAPTEKRTVEEVVQALAECTYQPSSKATRTEYSDGSSRPTYAVSWCTTRDKLSDSFDLIEELLFHTDNSDAEKMRMWAAEYGLMQKMIATAMPDMLLESYIQSYTSPGSAYMEYLNGQPYRRFVQQIQGMTDEEIVALDGRIRAARDMLMNRQSFLFTCVGGAEAIEAATTRAGELYQKLSDSPREAADYSSLPPLADAPLALVIEGTMQYNAQAISFDDCGFEDNGKLYAMSRLVFDKVLTTALRFQSSAYGARISLSKPTVYVSSYRDPNLAKSFELYQKLGDLIRELQLTQDDVDGYISKVYSQLAMPIGAYSGGATAVNNAVTGEDTFGDMLRYMKEIKQFTPEDVVAYASIFDKLAESGVRLTVGGAEAIEENRDMFHTIVTDLVGE